MNMEVSKINGYDLKDSQARKEISNLVKNNVKVHYINSGNNKGDCILIQSENKNVLIDFGYDETGLSIINYLSNNKINKIDYCIISHYHADHIGGASCEGLLNILNSLDFSECTFYLPNELDESKWIGAEITDIKNRESIIKSYLIANNINYIYPNDEDILNIDNNVNIRFINASVLNYEHYYTYTIEGNGNVDTGSTSYNNFSIVCELTHNNNIFLFTGDIEPKAQEIIYKKLKKCNVLKLEHHGANTNTNEEYLKKVVPEVAILTNLELTKYVLRKQTGAYLRSLDIPIYSTNESGNIVITSNGYNYSVDYDNEVVKHEIERTYFENSLKIKGDRGISLENETDLNNVKEDGIYFSGWSGLSSKLFNNPVKDTGFRLEVKNISNDDTFIQVIYPNNSLNTYIRNCYSNGENYVWSVWYLITPNTYGLGIELDEGMDLNNLQPGIYKSGYGGKSITLVNTPITNTGFRIEVKKLSNDDTLVQQLQPNNEPDYYQRIRYNNGTEYVWSNWKKSNLVDLT